MSWVGIDDHLLADDEPYVPAMMLRYSINAIDDANNRTRGAGHGFTAETGRRPDISTPTFEWREIAVFLVPWHVGIDTVNYRTRYELARGAEGANNDAMYARLVVEGVAGATSTLQTTASAATLELTAPVPVSFLVNQPPTGYLRAALQVRSIRGASSTATFDVRDLIGGGYVLADVTAGTTPSAGRSHYEMQITDLRPSSGYAALLYHVYAVISIGTTPVDVGLWIWPLVEPGTVISDAVKDYGQAELYDVGAITLHGRGAIWGSGGLTPIANRGARDCSPGAAVANLERYNADLRALLAERGRWWGHGPRGDLGATSYTLGYLLDDTDTGDDRILDAWTAEVRNSGVGVRVGLVAGIPYGTIMTDADGIPRSGRDVEFTVEARVYGDDGTLLTTVERRVLPNVAGAAVPRLYVDGPGSTLQFNLTGVSAANSGAGDAMGEDEHLTISQFREQPAPVTLVTIDVPWDATLSAGDRVRVVLICTDGTVYSLSTSCTEIVE